MSQQGATPVVKQATFLGHPVGLYILFFTEMWERFSYYGMRALLMLYMVEFFRFNQSYASSIYKIYTSLVYVTPIIGGYLADRYLGNKRAVIIGAILMAIGHFLMAFEQYAIFYSALIFLIIGNGFFKPNMSTQVGRLYPPNDSRLDGAYTIFYMGINLGAGISPLLCGWLRLHTVGEYHSGFTLAGIGMVIGLVIYLLGQPLVRELPVQHTPTIDEDKKATEGEHPGGPAVVAAHATDADAPASRAMTEEPVPLVIKTDALTEAEASRQPSVFGAAIKFIPLAFSLVGCLLVLGAIGWGVYLFSPALTAPNKFNLWKTIIEAFSPFMLSLAGVCLLLIGYIARQIRQGMRDRVLAILVLGVFVMFFWAVGEQAGNVQNVWAEQNTDTNITKPMEPAKVATVDLHEQGDEPASVKMQLVERFRNLFRLKPSNKPAQTWGDWAVSFINPMSAESFQSINPFAIILLAPLFAFMWSFLDKRGLQPSIPLKMFFGLVLASVSMAIMMGAANQANKSTSVALKGEKLPSSLTVEGNVVGLKTDGKFVPFHAGQLFYNSAEKKLEVHGVLPDTTADEIIGATAPEDFVKVVEDLKAKSREINGETVQSVEVKLDHVPPGFEMKFSLIKPSAVKYDPDKRTLAAFKELQEKEEKGLKVAAGDPQFRDTIHELFLKSNEFRVSAWWLFWSYIFMTLGELCLSPVGLSMVSKLAPAKFATMLMGVWMLTSAFGNFAAGALGEDWGTTAPIPFFLRTTLVAGGAALVLLILVRIVTKTMHGVK